MTYKLIFDKRTLKEWNKLGETLRQQFKNKLAERMINPRIQADKLKGENDLYKIKKRRLSISLSSKRSGNHHYCCIYWKKGTIRSL